MEYDPIDDPSNYIWGTFYFNKEDKRVIVPKRARLLGFTLNFANWLSYILVLIILLAALFSIYKN